LFHTWTFLTSFFSHKNRNVLQCPAWLTNGQLTETAAETNRPLSLWRGNYYNVAKAKRRMWLWCTIITVR